MIHNCLEGDGVSLDQSFAPVTMQVHPKSAKGLVTAKSKGALSALVKWIGMMLRERISGGYKLSPFFQAESGMPITTPIVLSLKERQALHK